MSGSLLVVTGPPGAGKSATAAHLARAFDRSVLVSGDAFFGFLREGRIAPWLPESDPQNATVTDAAARATGAFVDGGFHAVFDGILGPWSLDRFVAAAGVSPIDYALLLPPVETCVQRVSTRRRHEFRDEAATRHMHDQFARASVADRHVLRIDDLGADAAATADAVLARRAAGELRLRTSPRVD